MIAEILWLVSWPVFIWVAYKVATVVVSKYEQNIED